MEEERIDGRSRKKRRSFLCWNHGRPSPFLTRWDQEARGSILWLKTTDFFVKGDGRGKIVFGHLDLPAAEVAPKDIIEADLISVTPPIIHFAQN